jgi:integrase
MPKVIRSNKDAITKEDIVLILNACSTIKLKTYVMFLSATGCRAREALPTRLGDYDFSKQRVFIRGEYAKTKTDRYVFLTNELVEQLKSWITYKYRR